MGRYRHILLSLLFLLPDMQGMVCAASQFSPFTFHEARQTLAAADSVRVNEGRLYDDSLALAEAYVTTGKWRYIYPNDYARACYYYGYLLRQRGNQVAAMQAFIAGTHAPYIQRVVPLPWFNDYHILGRIYTNMGVMCHLADDFELGYAMYEHSAIVFQKSSDTTAYYYALNAMALELAEQKLPDETFALLNSIKLECADTGVLTKLWETKAILYYNLGQYDSTIYSSQELYSRGYQAATGYVKEAQAYWHLERYDSALYYAKLVVDHPYASAQDKYHVLYIRISHDSINSTQEVQALSAERADLKNQLIEPLLRQLSVAVELLQQDINSKRPFLNIFLFVFVIGIIGAITWLTRARTKRYTLHEQKKHQQLVRENAVIHQRNESIKQQYMIHRENLLKEIEHNSEVLRNAPDWKDKLHWKDYKDFCETADRYFHLLPSKLKAMYNLDEKEIRLCILVLLGSFGNKQLAKNLNYSESGIGTFKYRVSQKFNIQSKNLRDFLLELAVSGTSTSSAN